MSRNGKYGVCAAVLATALAVCAEAPSGVRWLDSRNYEFGTLREADGKATGQVRFVNEGDTSVRITRVRSACGCTVPTCSTEPVAPGDTAAVSFVYDPVRRPGRFEKRLKVFFEGCPTFEEIWLRGTVVGEDSSLALTFPVTLGTLRFESESADGGHLLSGESRHTFLAVYNQSTDTVAPKVSCDNPALETSLLPARIPPGDIGTIRFSFNTRKGAAVGINEIPVTVETPAGTRDIIYRAEVSTESLVIQPEPTDQ